MKIYNIYIYICIVYTGSDAFKPDLLVVIIYKYVYHITYKYHRECMGDNCITISTAFWVDL